MHLEEYIMPKTIGGNTGNEGNKSIGGSTGSGGNKSIGGSTGSSGNKSIGGSTGTQPNKPVSRETSNWNDGRNTQSTSSDCFVATAAFGTPLQTEIQILREWRDSELSFSLAGRQFIDIYYKMGPHLAHLVEKNKFIARISRSIIRQAIKYIKNKGLR